MLHVASLPHTQTTRAFDHCANTSKIRRFASMMTARGHDVILYAGEDNDADANLVTCVTKADQQEWFGHYDWWQRGEVHGLDFDPTLPHWQQYNARLISEIGQRFEPRDIICLPSGWPMQSVIDAFPDQLVVEPGIGYEGVAAPYRVWESYAWMHACYGKTGPSSTDGRFYDAVIPNFFEIDDFPLGDQSGDYFLFMSRMTHRKGYGIAIDATKAVGAPLKITGVGGDRPKADHVEYVGWVDANQRAELLGNARALLVPTIYLEPFGGVAVEAMLCGTPVISTDWGAFPEIVRQGVDGYRCRSMGEFVQACYDVADLDRHEIRDHAIARFSTDVIGARYDDYFDFLGTLYDGGFYTTQATRSVA